jgi:hypothetical protein
MKKADIISSAVVTLFGLMLVFVIIPIWVPTILDGDYGLRAKDMPIVASVSIIGLAASYFIYCLKTKAISSADDKAPLTRKNWLFLLQIAIFLLFVVSLFEWIGFLAAGPVTVGGFMFFMGERRPLQVGGTAIGTTLGIWLFFWQLLKFPLP